MANWSVVNKKVMIGCLRNLNFTILTTKMHRSFRRIAFSKHCTKKRKQFVRVSRNLFPSCLVDNCSLKLIHSTAKISENWPHRFFIHLFNGCFLNHTESYTSKGFPKMRYSHLPLRLENFEIYTLGNAISVFPSQYLDLKKNQTYEFSNRSFTQNFKGLSQRILPILFVI